MNVKIKAAGVTCLVGEDYSRVYATLVKSLGPLGAELFSERIPGHEYLQWELPGEGWTSLGEADPLMAVEVREELVRRKQEVSTRFAANQIMAQRVLSVPDESFVYYRPTQEGGLEIRLTAWGYRYPERIMGKEIESSNTKVPVESVRIICVYDGQPAGGEQIFLNGFAKKTDENGVYEVGELPVGYQFDVEARGRKQHITVLPGQGAITWDITEFVNLEVLVYQNEVPVSGVEVKVLYSGRELAMTTDEFGRAVGQQPLARDGGSCLVRVEEQEQQSPLAPPVTRFRFDLPVPLQTESEPVPEPIGSDVPEPPVVVEEPPVTEEEPPMAPKPQVAKTGSFPGWLLILLLLLMAAVTFTGCYFMLF